MNSSATLPADRLAFLAQLPLVLNSSLEVERVIAICLQRVRQYVQAEAATVFLLSPCGSTLSFWALEGGSAGVKNQKIPAGKGIVGWVIEKQEGALITDVEKDPRFYKELSDRAQYQVRNLICVPLTAKGDRRLGAIQILNSTAPSGFTPEDLTFLEQFASHVGLALDNARMYESLLEQQHKLQVLERRKSEMISVISHEFVTPLSIIRASTEMLATDELKPEQRQKMAQGLTDAAARLTRLVAQVKNLSLVTKEDLKLACERLPMREILVPICEQFSAIAQTRTLTFVREFPEHEVILDLDPALFRIALSNLLSNAVRFTPDGGTIRLTVAVANGLAEFRVSDTGIGIEKEHLPLIFEKFYEAVSHMYHSSGDYQFKSAGLGIGLPTAKAILAAHQSSIEVESAPGKGSTFRFALPVVM